MKLVPLKLLVLGFLVAGITANAAPLTAKSTPPDKFDLACSGQDVVTGVAISPVRFRIDVSKQEWCQEGSSDCPRSLLVEADKLWLYASESNLSEHGVITLNWWVDRATGTLHMHRDFNRDKVRIEGQCRLEPYNTATKKLF